MHITTGVLGVSRWMCTLLWVYVERYEVGVYVTIGGFNADVYVAPALFYFCCDIL